MSVLKKFAGDTIIYGLSTIIARLLNFVLTPIFVRKFPASVYGIFTHMYSWAAMLNAVLAFGMETAFFRFLHKQDKEKEKVYGNTFLVTLFTASAFIIFLLLSAEKVAIWLNNGVYSADYEKYVQFFGFILVADALAVVPFAYLRAQGKAMRFVLLKLINILVFVGLNFFFLFGISYLAATFPGVQPYLESWYREGWVGYVFISNLIASGFTLLFLLPELLKLQLRLDRQLMGQMLRYSFPILIANISFIINEHVDKLLLPKLLPDDVGRRDVGIYGAVTKIAVFLSIFVQAFRLGAEPFFFSQAKQANARQTYATIMEYFIIAMVLVMVGITANIEWLKYFIKGDTPAEQAEYWSGLHIVPILLFNYVLLGIYMNLSIWYKLSDQTRFGLYISGVGAVVTVVLNYVFIPHYSYVASAWVTTAAYAVMVLLSYAWGQKHYTIPYRVSKNMVYLAVGILICWLSVDVFDSNLWVGNLMFISFAFTVVGLEGKKVFRLFVKQ